MTARELVVRARTDDVARINWRRRRWRCTSQAVRGEADQGETIQLSLEQRQVGILAVSALVLLGVVFALGVLVGRQLASAALAAPAQPPAGDLRALDAAKPPPSPSVPAPVVAIHTPEAARVAAPEPAHPSPAHAEPSPGASASTPHPASPANAAPAASGPAGAPPSSAEILAAAEDSDDAEEADASEPAGGKLTVAAPGGTLLVPAPARPLTVAAPKNQDGPLPPPPEHLGRYTVQFGATQDRKDAERLEARARAQGLKPYIVAAHLGAKGTWYRLRAGAFDSHDEALAYQKDIDRELHVHAAVMPTN